MPQAKLHHSIQRALPGTPPQRHEPADGREHLTQVACAAVAADQGQETLFRGSHSLARGDLCYDESS
eukprot:269964-Pelagomonas_calceolata.AAC.1